MNVLNYFLIFFVVLVQLMDVDSFPAKDKHGRSMSRLKKKLPEKQLYNSKTGKSILKRPKRTIPPELAARHRETLRCLRTYLNNQRLGIRQPYPLPVIPANYIKYQPNYQWTPNHRPYPNYHTSGIDASLSDKPKKTQFHNQVLKINKPKKDFSLQVNKHVSGTGLNHVAKKGVDLKLPGLSAHLDVEIKRRGDEGVLVDKAEREAGFHTLNLTTPKVNNDYEVHETILDDFEGNHHVTETSNFLQDGKIEDLRQEAPEDVTELWDPKKINEEVEEVTLAEPIDLLRLKDDETATEKKLAVREPPKPEEARLDEGVTEKIVETVTILETRLEKDERNVEMTVVPEGRGEVTEMVRNFGETTVPEAKFGQNRDETTVSGLKATETDDVRNLDSANLAQISQNYDQTTLPEIQDDVRNLYTPSLEKLTIEEVKNEDGRGQDTPNLDPLAVPEVKVLETEESRSKNTEDFHQTPLPEVKITESDDARNLYTPSLEKTTVEEVNDDGRGQISVPEAQTEGRSQDTQHFYQTTVREVEISESDDARNLGVEQTTFAEVKIAQMDDTRSQNIENLEQTTLSEVKTAENDEARNLEVSDLDQTTLPEVRIDEVKNFPVTNFDETTYPDVKIVDDDARNLDTSDFDQTTVNDDARHVNFDETTLPEFRTQQTDDARNLPVTNYDETTLPEVKIIENDDARNLDTSNIEQTTLREVQIADSNQDFDQTEATLPDVRNYPVDETTQPEELKQERKLHDDQFLESNDIDPYPQNTESNDVSYEEERTNSLISNLVLHIDQISKNLSSMNQILSETSTEKRRSDILITDEYKEELNLSGTETPADFTPESLIQLIPVIIHDLRNKSVNPEDAAVLSQVFGKLWPIINNISKNPSINITQLLNIRNEEDLRNLIHLFEKLQEEDLEQAETASFGYSTTQNDPSLYDYVDDHQEISYDQPADEIVEDSSEFYPRSSDFSNFGEFQNDFSQFESQDVPETFGETEYETAEDISDGYYETNPSVLELVQTAQAHEAKNIRLPSSKPKFPDESFSEDGENFFI